MPKLFGVDIQGLVAKNLGPGLLVATLSKVTGQTRTDGTGGLQPTTDDYNCKGFISDYNDYQLNGTLILTGDRQVLLLGGTLPNNIVPKSGDKVTIESLQYNIIRVKRDPAAATYTCQVRS